MHRHWRRLASNIATRDVSGPILDVATGTGDITFDLARCTKSNNIVGLDFSPEMLHLATDKAKNKRLNDRITYVLGDALALPFADDIFSSVTSGFALRNVIDLPQTLKEITRVVKSGGKVVFIEITPVQGKGFFDRIFPIYFRHVTPLLGAIFSGDKEAYTYLPQSVDHFPNAARLVQLMENAGLQNVTYSKVGLGTVAIHSGMKPLS